MQFSLFAYLNKYAGFLKSLKTIGNVVFQLITTGEYRTKSAGADAFLNEYSKWIFDNNSFFKVN